MIGLSSLAVSRIANPGKRPPVFVDSNSKSMSSSSLSLGPSLLEILGNSSSFLNRKLLGSRNTLPNAVGGSASQIAAHPVNVTTELVNNTMG